MTGKKVLLLFFLLLTLAGYLFLNHKWSVEQDIIYLKDGTTIIADQTWEGGKLTYYRENNRTQFVLKKEVAYLGKGDIQRKFTGRDLLTRYVRQGITKVTNLLNISESEMIMAKEWFMGAVKNNLKWIFLAVVLLAVYVTTRKLKQHAQKEDKISDGFHLDDPMAEITPRSFEDYSDTEKVVSFFLDLYKLQIGAPPDAVAQLFPADIKAFGTNKIYQLQVKQGNEWASRRMTIGPLGEDSGAKSKCYYVIYDVHMVIKVPPDPIRDFDFYMDSIKKEGRIVDKLAPRECIIPRVSVIMQRVYTFARKDLPLDVLEERYITLLGKRTDLQEYLKIGDTFVFFMDLSKYFFLGHIISNLHDMDQKMHDEIMQNPKIVWDAQEFGGRYGHANAGISLQLQNIFAEYESELKQNMPKVQGKASILQYQMKEWFLAHLAGKRIDVNDKGLAGTTADEMNSLLEDIFTKHGKTISAYMETVRKYVNSISFSQSKAQIESIIINTLDLLTWIRKKKVAIRDLKPDNLLVAGDTSEYPKFLSSANQFTIGLIDVETAVDYEAEDNATIQQPQLGGTPNYATPSHLFRNEYLNTVFPDLPQILHLQDWQATIAIIYKVAVGETLFKKTGKLMPVIIKQMKQSKEKKLPVQEIIINAGKIFWPSAIAEFNAKIKAKENLLESVIINLTGDISEMLKEEALKSGHYYTQAIAARIDSQTLFKDGKKRRQLHMASHKNITQLLKKWEKDHLAAKVPAAKQKITFLKTIEELKQKAEDLAEMVRKLDQPPVTFPLSELLPFMFNIVLTAMYKPEWRTAVAPITDDTEDQADEREYEKTI